MLFMQPCFWIMSPQSFHWVTTPSRRQYHAARSFQFSGGHRMPWWHLHLLFCILPDKEFPVRGLLSTFSSQSILCMRRCCQKVFLMTALSPTTQSWLVACRPQFLNAGAFYSLVGKCPTPFLSLCGWLCACVSEPFAQPLVIQKMDCKSVRPWAHTASRCSFL